MFTAIRVTSHSSSIVVPYFTSVLDFEQTLKYFVCLFPETE